MQNFGTKKIAKELSKLKKPYKKLSKILSLDKLKEISSISLTKAYQDFKKK